MTPDLGFAVFLALTLVLLALVVVTGLRARRRWHIPLVACALAGLGTTIYYAEQMGEHYDLATAGVITPIHLWIAKITTLSYLLPLATGIRTLYDPRMRRWHRRVAFLVLWLTLITAITGTWMILAAERL